ncbi:MAG: terminase small subunit [Candidatus Altiarchaeota archaeon]|nr:terminase small subunit [Candidatus Altiarchaeota archaeon]
MEAEKTRTLTDRQLLFVDKYFELKFQKIDAYMRAYPNVKKRNTAHAAASRLLDRPEVAVEIDRRRREMREANKTIVDKIRDEIEALAFANMQDYLTFGPGYVTLKHSSGLTPEQMAAIAEITETVNVAGGGSVRFKLYSKDKALELLMKYYGLIIEKAELTGKDGKPLGDGWVNMGEIIDGIRKAQKPGTLWNEGPKLEDGDLDE